MNHKVILFIGLHIFCLQAAQVSHAQFSFTPSCCDDEKEEECEEEAKMRSHRKRLLKKMAHARKKIFKNQVKDETTSLTPVIFPGSLGQTHPSRPGIDLRERKETAEKIDGFILVQNSEDLNTIKENSSLTLINSPAGSPLGAPRSLDEPEILR